MFKPDAQPRREGEAAFLRPLLKQARITALELLTLLAPTAPALADQPETKLAPDSHIFSREIPQHGLETITRPLFEIDIPSSLALPDACQEVIGRVYEHLEKNPESLQLVLVDVAAGQTADWDARQTMQTLVDLDARLLEVGEDVNFICGIDTSAKAGAHITVRELPHSTYQFLTESATLLADNPKIDWEKMLRQKPNKLDAAVAELHNDTLRRKLKVTGAAGLTMGFSAGQFIDSAIQSSKDAAEQTIADGSTDALDSMGDAIKTDFSNAVYEDVKIGLGLQYQEGRLAFDGTARLNIHSNGPTNGVYPELQLNLGYVYPSSAWETGAGVSLPVDVKNYDIIVFSRRPLPVLINGMKPALTFQTELNPKTGGLGIGFSLEMPLWQHAVKKD